jgi:hypothetical protein
MPLARRGVEGVFAKQGRLRRPRSTSFRFWEQLSERFDPHLFKGLSDLSFPETRFMLW